MAITKEDIEDVVKQWADRDLLDWQARVEGALIDIASCLFEEENASQETKDLMGKVIEEFTA